MSTEPSTENEGTPEAPSEDPISERVASVFRILPIQDAPRTTKNDLRVKRGPGRPRKVERMPTTDDLTYHAEMAEERQKFISSDPLVKRIEENADVLGILRLIKLEVAKEAASLGFESLEQSKRGKDMGQLTSRRVEALKRIADIELKIKEIDAEAINLSSERIQRIFALWVEVMREVANEVLPPESIDLFFNKFATAMEGWEERAGNALR